VTKALPPNQAFLAVPLTGAIQNTTRTIVNGVLSSSQFQRAWPVVLGRVHGQLVALLKGDTRNVVVQNNQLQVNFIPVIVSVLNRLQNAAPGLITFKAPLPTQTEAKSPTVARQQLSKALGIPLKPTFGTIVIADSSQLGQAQHVVNVFDFLVFAIPILTFILATLTILLAHDRRRMLIELGISLMIAFLLALVLIDGIKERMYAAVKNGTARDLVQETLPRLTQSLKDLSIFLAVVGLLVAIGAYLAGRPEWFMRLLAHFQRRTEQQGRVTAA
jgi:hypothetical protein